MSQKISPKISPKMFKEIRYTITETFSRDVSKCRQFFCKDLPIFVDLIVYISGDNLGDKEKAFARLFYDIQNHNISIISFNVNSEDYPELKGIGKYLLCTGIELLYTKYKLDTAIHKVSLLRAEKKSGNNKNGNKLGEYYKNTYGFEYVIEQEGSMAMVVNFDIIKKRCDTIAIKY
jgi:hypothetical protein